MKNLLKRFNLFFKGTAKAVVINGNLEITIGSQTLIISFYRRTIIPPTLVNKVWLSK